MERTYVHIHKSMKITIRDVPICKSAIVQKGSEKNVNVSLLLFRMIFSSSLRHFLSTYKNDLIFSITLQQHYPQGKIFVTIVLG